MKNYTIKNPIKRIPTGMLLNRRIYYISSPIGLISKVRKEYDCNEAFGVMRIVSYIRIAQKQYCDGKNLYANISRDVLRACAGDNYRTYIDWLIENKIIEVNESYSSEKHYTKSYRYADKAYNKSLTVTKWEIDVLKETSEKYNEKLQETTFTPNGQYDNELLYCLEHENLLSVPNPEEIIDTLQDEDKSYASEWFYEINKGQCFPTPQEKSTRFYFNSIMMSSSLRKYLIYNKKETLINFDIKTAYPAFTKFLAMLPQYKDNIPSIPTYVSAILIGGTIKNERGTLCFDFYNNGDFYDSLMSNTNMTRKQCKIEYNKYTNSNDVEYKRNHIFTDKLITMGNGDMAEYIIQANNIWLILEAVETAIMVWVCNECIDKQLPFIRQHDGFITTSDSLYDIEEILNRHFGKIFTFKAANL